AEIVRIEERIRYCGKEITETDFARLATEVRLAVQTLVDTREIASAPTFFEQVTAIALMYFRECGGEFAILEVGLGGRLDATNSVDPVISAVTSIDYDHHNILGNSIPEIAREKAGIIKPGARAVIGRQKYEEAGETLMRQCLEMNVLPVFVNQPVDISAGDLGRITFGYESTQSKYSRILLGL